MTTFIRTQRKVNVDGYVYLAVVVVSLIINYFFIG
jgi:hypothetical protein